MKIKQLRESLEAAEKRADGLYNDYCTENELRHELTKRHSADIQRLSEANKKLQSDLCRAKQCI